MNVYNTWKWVYQDWSENTEMETNGIYRSENYSNLKQMNKTQNIKLT